MEELKTLTDTVQDAIIKPKEWEEKVVQKWSTFERTYAFRCRNGALLCHSLT